MTGGARSPRREVAQPLWAQILADLRRRLSEGEFPGNFPGELALMAEYGVSRHTIRESLRRLRAEGVVTANRGRRPRVVAPETIQQRAGALYSLFTSVAEAGLDQHSVVRRLERHADGVIAARLGLEESSPLVYLERLRVAGAEPLALDRVWLPATLAAPLLDVDFRHTSLYAEYARRCGVRVTGGHEQIRAVLPEPAQRRLLGLPADAAAFAIERLGCADRRPVEWRRTVVRGDRFVVTADMRMRPT